MIRRLALSLLLLLSSGVAHADWGTSTAIPTSGPFVCWSPSDGADMRGQSQICWWEPDSPYEPWSDSLGSRAGWCSGNPGTGDVDVIANDGECARVHGLASTDAQPFGFRFGSNYVLLAGWYGLQGGTFYTEVQIASYRIGPNTHAIFCSGDLTGPANDPCRGSSSSAFASASASAIGGTLAFTPHSFTAGTNAPTPAVCTATPQKWSTCPTRDKSGLQVVLGGDGFPRAGGYAVLGNPITGPGGVPCLGVDQSGAPAVLVYPLQGAQTTNPDGSLAYVPVCP
jgi:hypothetical protein